VSGRDLKSQPAAMPTGTVTFLFSDVEGSTERWEAHREAMTEAMRRHDALLHAAIDAHGGCVFKTIGDAFCAVFATAPQAVAAACDAQAQLVNESWESVGGLRVRFAVHTGEADERDRDYFGPAVNRVARLLAIGHGGQVLVSGVTSDLTAGALPPRATLRDLGQHRLRDLTRPEWVYQLLAPGLPAEFPPLRSLDALPNNLPRQVTSFVGRDADVAEIRALLAQTKLLTIVGTGGVGKTRTALQVGADLLDGSGDGVWIVEFAPLSDPSLVTSATAATFGLTESPERSTLDAIVAYLKRKRMLLLLDNCEHVVAAAAALASAISRSCPDVTILATSREGLGIAGETVYRMPSLPVPPLAESRSAEHALAYGAVALFEVRARASNTRFAVTDENAVAVSEICRRLDGIPLAIELAAARIKVLSVKALAQKLDERFRLLTGGDRAALPRQQTMRALVDWSYDLLAEQERALFRRLAVFAGGFTLETAAAVCSDEAIDEADVLDLLSSLVEKSLVQAELAGDDTRYRLLESTRQYALEKLRERGEFAALAARHAATYAELAERTEETYLTTPEPAWFAQLEPELDNWRAALTWALTERGDVPLGVRIAAGLRWVWYAVPNGEGRRWMTLALASEPDASAETKLLLGMAVANLTRWTLVRADMERALELCGQTGDALSVAEAQLQLGYALKWLGEGQRGCALVDEALAAFRAAGVRKHYAWALTIRATMSAHNGQIDEALRQREEALAIFKALGANSLIAACGINLAEIEFNRGNTELAIALATEAVTAQAGVVFKPAGGIAFGNMAAYFLALGRFDESRSSAAHALAIWLAGEAEAGMLFCMQHLSAQCARPDVEPGARREHMVRAARVFGFVEHHIERLAVVREETELFTQRLTTEALERYFTADELARLLDDGSLLSREQAVAEASSL
jgi:predicted ATPase/class 3 adenylate cyclase